MNIIKTLLIVWSIIGLSWMYVEYDIINHIWKASNLRQKIFIVLVSGPIVWGLTIARIVIYYIVVFSRMFYNFLGDK